MHSSTLNGNSNQRHFIPRSFITSTSSNGNPENLSEHKRFASYQNIPTLNQNEIYNRQLSYNINDSAITNNISNGMGNEKHSSVFGSSNIKKILSPKASNSFTSHKEYNFIEHGNHDPNISSPVSPHSSPTNQVTLKLKKTQQDVINELTSKVSILTDKVEYLTRRLEEQGKLLQAHQDMFEETNMIRWYVKAKSSSQQESMASAPNQPNNSENNSGFSSEDAISGMAKSYSEKIQLIQAKYSSKQPTTGMSFNGTDKSSINENPVEHYRQVQRNSQSNLFLTPQNTNQEFSSQSGPITSVSQDNIGNENATNINTTQSQKNNALLSPSYWNQNAYNKPKQHVSFNDFGPRASELRSMDEVRHLFNNLLHARVSSSQPLNHSSSTPFESGTDLSISDTYWNRSYEEEMNANDHVSVNSSYGANESNEAIIQNSGNGAFSGHNTSDLTNMSYISFKSPSKFSSSRRVDPQTKRLFSKLYQTEKNNSTVDDTAIRFNRFKK